MIAMVVGVSGVGKTSLVRRLETNGLYSCIRASEFLRKNGRPLMNLTSNDFLTNQLILRIFLQREQKSKRIVLDSHLAIETIDGARTIPDAWFDGLAIGGLICVRDSASRIAGRRGTPDNIIEIESRQELEMIEAERQSERLNVPLKKIMSGDFSSFETAITDVLGN
jgi:adenylate kinase